MVSALVCHADEEWVVINSEKTIVVGNPDEYTWKVHIPILVADSIVRVFVAQKDEGDTFPYYFEVGSLRDGFFETVVDNEYDTDFQLLGFTKENIGHSVHFVFHPTPEMLQNSVSGIDEIGGQVKERIVSVHSLSGKAVTPKDIATDWKTYQRTLPKGIYVVTYTDAGGKLTSRKEILR